MSRIEISRVESRREQNAFIKFPWRIYRNDPAWVPPLILERKAFLDRKRHPFYKHGDAQLFLARRDGQVAAALFDAAGDWARLRGRNEIMGPIDYSTNYMCALLIDGFEHPPTLLTSHNPPYYQRLIEDYGFAKARDWYAWWFSEFPAPAERLRRIATARAGKLGVKIRPVNLKRIESESQRIRTIYNQAWKKNWGFVPFTEAEMDHMAKEMKPLIVPEAMLIADIDNEPVGFVIGVPDINVALRHINGRLTRFGLPIGLIKLLYYRLKTRTGRLIALGVVEKYRRAGIAEMLVLQLMDEAFKRGFTGELSMTLEDNVMVNRFIEAMGADRYKTYRIYNKTLE